MSGAPPDLDPLRLPLRGAHLIEAGAGTGKTWNIAAIYLRLILGHGDAAAYARPLIPPEILVVTFTEAATEELRGRIRTRLAEAAAAFRAADSPADPFIAALRADYAPQDWPACAQRLEAAAGWMDEAAISTIHAWCQRMLHEHAFDSGQMFDVRLESDSDDLFTEVTRDYWRQFLTPLAPAHAAEIAAWWPDPQTLASTLARLLGAAETLPPAPPPAESMPRAADARARLLAALKAPWPAWADALESLLDAATARKGVVDARKLKPAYYRPWLAALRRWAHETEQIEPELSPTAWARLTPAGLAEVWKQGKPPAHPALSALASLREQLSRLPNAREDVLRHAGRWVAERFAAEQTRQACMGFDDLLTRLAHALTQTRGAVLAERLRARFPVALIDEFQDTDPVQYAIFERVYRPRENSPDTALILIGDPKQAIYAFRGADIYTYLAARKDCSGRIHTLRHNHRSSAALVRAVNHVFGRAEARAGGMGAFRFRRGEDNPLPFIAAIPQGRPGRLRVEGDAPAALTLWWIEPEAGAEKISQDDYRRRMAAACAGEIARLLELGAAGRAGIEADTGEFSPLHPSDIAVLVNDRIEAAAVRAALTQRGVASVYLSERESVFKSPLAADLQRWLAACAEPQDPMRLRAALASPSLGLDWAELDRLQHDDAAWEMVVARFHAYRAIWQRQGVLPMLRRLMHDYDVAARLLARPDGSGERVLTDLLHLAEILQTTAAKLEGEHALLRHLAQARRQDDGNAHDGRRIRLESDANRVQIVTVHKSKGLEYPLVFLPYAARVRKIDAKSFPLYAPDATGRRRLWLCAEPEALARAQDERLNEDLRRLYVALTRARLATWVGIAGVADLGESAIGHLLAEGGVVPQALAAVLHALAAGCPDIRAQAAPEDSAARFTAKATLAFDGQARTPRRPPAEPWWIASYSALRVKTEDSTAAPPESAAEAIFREDATPPSPALPIAASGLHAFPRGAEVGIFLHEWLQWAAAQGFAPLASRPETIAASLRERCAARGWSAWTAPLAGWAQAFLRQRFPLSDSAFSLAELARPVAEMEFWIGVTRLDALWLDRQVRTHTLAAAPRPPLTPQRLHGMLKGFIDLVFEWEGRYYVADYKSNWLGPNAAAYAPENLRQAILEARYDLQYTLYLLALHRLLRARLPDYDYERHIGGAVYLFLRGLDAPGHGVYFERPPRVLIETLDAAFCGEFSAAGAPA